MSKLKTLKDLKVHTTDVEWQKALTDEEFCVGFRELRQEAIKWIKLYKNFPQKNRPHADAEFKYFFNITDEELKNG